ncbi:hypothetical protein HY631_00020 [Candidatus Uhrbacteria bacterium]|nr:hypothetical protein [Candidatus Uhrbacteria bacterium]
MATDRWISWQVRRPTQRELWDALEDYIGISQQGMNGCLGSVVWNAGANRWCVRIQGRSSHPLKRIGKPPPPKDLHLPEREIEIFWDDDSIDIITRFSDPVTNAIADGFQKFCLEYWDAKLDRG